MTVGASTLAKKDAIVSKLVAIDEMAGVEYSCADKTGTITKNEPTVSEMKTFKKYTENDILLFATLASREEDNNPIDNTIIMKAKTLEEMPASIASYRVASFKPLDSRVKADRSNGGSQRRQCLSDYQGSTSSGFVSRS